MISMQCPHCHEALSIPDQYAGQSGACTHCGARIVVPQANTISSGGDPVGLPDDLMAALNASLDQPRPRPVVRQETLGDKLQPLLKPLGIAAGAVAVVALLMAGMAYLPAMKTARTPGPEEVARGFMDAMKSGNVQQCQPWVTAKSWELLSQAPPAQTSLQAFDSYTVGATTTSGTTAQVQLQVTQFGMTQTNEILLRQDNSAWRVHGVRVTPMPGMTMTMDFENPEAMLNDLKGMMENMPPEVMEQMEKAMQQQGGFR